ncbi:MAG: hypothetical protein AB7P07_09840 [Hyphomonadaceae bacterium]
MLANSWGMREAVAGEFPCSADLREVYFSYRQDVREQLDLRRSAHAYSVGPVPTRMLLATRTPFTPPPDLLECWANRGDQLALYLRGRRRIDTAATSQEFLAGLDDIERAAAANPAVSLTDCSIIERVRGYSCQSGLPEAHLYLGALFSNCTSALFRPDIARFHIQIALLQGTFRAYEADCSLSLRINNPRAAGCTFAPPSETGVDQ